MGGVGRAGREPSADLGRARDGYPARGERILTGRVISSLRRISVPTS